MSSKIGALENMIQHVDKFIIGGAMANTFLKSTGCDMGKSKVEMDLIDVASAIINKAVENGIKFYLPLDAVQYSSTYVPSALDIRFLYVEKTPPWSCEGSP